MTNTEREQIEASARKSVILREVWLRERQEALAEQSAANAEMKQRWELSDPIEVSQRRASREKRSRA